MINPFKSHLQSTLYDRAKGQYPVSIGTSLALESLNNIHPELVHRRIPIGNYDLFMVNIRTIFRNIYQSVDTSYRDRHSASAYLSLLVDELIFLKELIDEKNQEGYKCQLMLFASEYGEVIKKYPLAAIRDDNTSKQRIASSYYAIAIKEMFRNKDFINQMKIKLYRDQITDKFRDKRVLMLTHLPYDLINFKNFRILDLLESHTGKVKGKLQFNTKYLNGKQLTNIPFDIHFLMIFGDKEMFKPSHIKIRNAIIECAKKDRWTAMTPIHEAIISIGKLKDPILREQIKIILSR